MSPSRHREVNAKVEGRDPPEKAKGTMETFRTLTKRLLNVSQCELQEQDRLCKAREKTFITDLKSTRITRRTSLSSGISNSSDQNGDATNKHD